MRGGVRIIPVAGSHHREFVRSFGAETVIDYRTANWEAGIPPVDVLIDTVAGESAQRAFPKVNSSGNLPQRRDVRSMFFYAEVTTRLQVDHKIVRRGEDPSARGLGAATEGSAQRPLQVGRSTTQGGKDRAGSCQTNIVSRTGEQEEFEPL